MTSRLTGTGALPYDDPAEAAAFVKAAAGVPFLPALPNRHPEEGQIARWGDGLCGCGVDDTGSALTYGIGAGPRGEAHAGARAVLLSLDRDTPLVVTSATGPITLAAAMVAGGHPGGRSLWDGVATGLIARIGEHVEEIALHLPGSEIVVMIDEPTLGTFGTPDDDALGALDAVMGAVPVGTGISCCGEADWGTIARLEPSWLTIDTNSIGLDFNDAASDLARIVSVGTRIIWAAVPAVAPPLPSVPELVARIRRAEGLLVLAGADIRRLDRALVGPGCGLEALTVDQADAVVERAAEVVEALDA
ncbi:hypothetical protein HQ535_10770 [bacterium]|nr:hypothetical protein [bacterium]